MAMGADPAEVYRSIGVTPIITASGSTTAYGGSNLKHGTHKTAAHRGAQARMICIASSFGLGPETRGEMIGWVMPACRYSSSLRRHLTASPTKAILLMSSVGTSRRASSWLPSFQSRRTAWSSSVKPACSISLRYRGNPAAYLAMLVRSPSRAPSPALPAAQGNKVATSTSPGLLPARLAPSATCHAAVSACSRVHQVIKAP